MMRHDPTRHAMRHRRHGFTLVEVVLVVVIAGLIGAIAVPRYAQSLTRYSADAAAQRLVADLNYARNRAAARSKAVVVNFDPATDTYTLDGLDDPDHPGQTYATDLQQNPYSADITTADFAGRAYFTFDGYGKPTSSGVVTLNAGDRTIQVGVSAATGEAAIR